MFLHYFIYHNIIFYVYCDENNSKLYLKIRNSQFLNEIFFFFYIYKLSDLIKYRYQKVLNETRLRINFKCISTYYIKYHYVLINNITYCYYLLLLNIEKIDIINIIYFISNVWSLLKEKNALMVFIFHKNRNSREKKINTSLTIYF